MLAPIPSAICPEVSLDKPLTPPAKALTPRPACLVAAAIRLRPELKGAKVGTPLVAVAAPCKSSGATAPIKVPTVPDPTMAVKGSMRLVSFGPPYFLAANGLPNAAPSGVDSKVATPNLFLIAACVSGFAFTKFGS